MENYIPTLYVMVGLQGSGKSVVAKMISEKKDAVWLRTDEIRKEMYPDPKYTEKEKQDVYNEFLTRARTFLSDGKDVVLDATFHTQDRRQQAYGVRENLESSLRIIEVISSDENLVKERMDKRQAADPKEAGYEVRLKFQKLLEPFKEEEKPFVSIINNIGTLAETELKLEEIL